ncbi:MAG: malate synthase A, partial [Chryseobacterium sp.]
METKTQLKIKAEQRFEEIFSNDLIDFLVELHQNFNPERLELLEERKKTQQEFDKGILPKFLSQEIRNDDWV